MALAPAALGLMAWFGAGRFHVGIIWVIAALLALAAMGGPLFQRPKWAVWQVVSAVAVATVGLPLWGEAGRVLLVLVAWGTTCNGLASLTSRWGLGADALRLALLIVWLTFPAWVGDHAAVWIAQWLLPLHPFMVLNGAAPSLGIWTEFPLIYRWTAWGQDIPAPLPGIGWFVGLHATIAVATYWAASSPRR